MAMKRLWVLGALMLLIVFSIIAYYYPRIEKYSPEEVNVCLHIWDYCNNTISFFDDLRVRWVRTDWINLSIMKVYSQALQDNSINLLTIIDINTFNQKKPTLEEWNKSLTEFILSDGFSDVDAVEIWNEPNSKSFDEIAYIEPDRYYEMLKSAYLIIKNYTDVEVVFSGISPNVDYWQDYLVDVFSHNDANDYFDVMGIHLYDDSNTNIDTLNFIKSLTLKPIWVTETGKPSNVSGEEAQANYLISFYESISPLVDKIFIYEFLDNSGLIDDNENHFGLLTINGTKKQAYRRVWELAR